MDNMPYRTYAEVNLQQLIENTRKVRALLSKDCKLLSVLKADAYGHGAVTCAKVLEPLSDYFAVASFEEAKELRDSGIHIPLLVFGFIDDQNIQEASEKDITCSCLSYAYAKHIQSICEKQNIVLAMHVKLDTGFHRLGIDCNAENINEVAEQVDEIYKMKNLHITGIFTHFSTAGSKVKEDIEFMNHQYDIFANILDVLSRLHVDVGIRHCCNSKATLTNPKMHLDMVRVGLYLYGLGNDEDLACLKLTPIVKWKARVYAIKEVNAHEAVGYSRAFITNQKMKIGVVALGFADGYARCFYTSTEVYVLVHGQKTRILGKICMDVMMIDLTQISGVQVGDYITVLGRDGEQVISANLLGKEAGGTAVEITCNMGKRVQRVYHDNEKEPC